MAQLRRSNLVGARRDLERALRIKRTAFGIEHPELLPTLLGLVDVARDENAPDEELVRWCERIIKHSLSSDHPLALAFATRAM
jgi:hypothetical protein